MVLKRKGWKKAMDKTDFKYLDEKLAEYEKENNELKETILELEEKIKVLEDANYELNDKLLDLYQENAK